MIGTVLWLAFRQLGRNKTRTALTSLGILIGVAAVIVMVSIGRGATRSVEEDLASLGQNLLFVTPGSHGGPGRGAGAPFSEADVQAIGEQVAGVSAVAAVSLVVGWIGIMNIMLVSVTERTREIGIRLAVGALARDVLLQFLVEAMVLAAVGGVAGVAVGLLVGWVAAQGLGIPYVASPDTVLLAFGFSGVIGVVFGYFPARRAARMKPIDALRHE